MSHAAPEISCLKNGLRVVSTYMPDAASVALGLWVGVGTRHEPECANGAAHLVEHMLFKGTPTRSAFDIAAQMEAVGGNMNAYTTREQTAYYARVLPEHAELALDILSDMLLRAVLDETELERERGVILQEIGQSFDTPDDHIHDLLQEAAYPDQSMGRPILGRAAVIAALPRAALTEYVQSLYRADAVILSVAGPVPHAALHTLAEKYLASLPAGQASPPPRSAYRGGEIRDRRDSEQLHIMLALPGSAYGSTDYYTANVYATLLGGGMSSRLFQEVREKRGLVYGIHSHNAPYLDDGLFVIGAGTDPERIAELIPVTCTEIVKTAEGVTAEEIDRAKAQLRASIRMSQDSVMMRAELAAQHLLIHGRILPLSEILDKLEAVNAEQLRRFAQQLCAGPLTLAAIGPVDGLESAEAIAQRLRHGHAA